MRIGRTIYLDHQATTPVHPQILSEMTPYFAETFGNPHSSDHFLGWESSRAVETAAARVARLIGADPDEITFTSGATESNNLGLLGLARRASGGDRRRILVSAIEHKCVLAIGRVLEEQYGYSVEQIPVDCDGFVNPSALQEIVDDDVLAVSVMAVNNEIGTIQDIEEISKVVRSYGAVFHCDAAQAPLAVAMSSFAEHVDLLSLSAHKMYGPKGIGVAYVRRELQNNLEPLIYGGGQQNDLRSGTVPVPLCVGMGLAAELWGSDEASQYRKELGLKRDSFLEMLVHLGWEIEINGPGNEMRHPGNANVQFVGFSAHEILNALQPHVAASTGSACTSGIAEPSHVLRALGVGFDEVESSIRFSLGFDTTRDDIEEAVAHIQSVLNRLANTGLARSI